MSLIRGLLFENMGLKLVALLLALVVYRHVSTHRPATMTVAFPVETTDLADTLAIVSQSPTIVSADLKGTGKQLIRIRLTEPRIRVSLAGVGPGRFQRALTVDDLPLVKAEGFEVSRFVGPQMLELTIDRRIQRELPVAARVEGAPPPGVAWSGAWLAAPPRVTVRGPRGALARLDSVWLAPVRLEGGRDTVRAEVRASNLGPGCEMTPATVAVRLPLTRVAH